MRPCATASAVFTGLFLTAITFAACSGGPGAPQQRPDSAPPPPPSPAAPDPAAAASADIPAESLTTAPLAPTGKKKAPETVADCKQLLTEIANEPPAGGVVMNNAMPSADAGSSDRLDPIVATIRSKRDSFRCCFDLYARKNPGAHGKITWQLKLKPDGAVEEATIVQEKSDVTAREVESCMADLARSISWARSPSGKDTTLSYPFDFKSR